MIAISKRTKWIIFTILGLVSFRLLYDLSELRVSTKFLIFGFNWNSERAGYPLSFAENFQTSESIKKTIDGKLYRGSIYSIKKRGVEAPIVEYLIGFEDGNNVPMFDIFLEVFRKCEFRINNFENGKLSVYDDPNKILELPYIFEPGKYHLRAYKPNK